MKSIIFDTETTGLLLPSTAELIQQPYIVELGAVLVEGGQIIAELDQLLSIPIPMPKDATKANHITEEMLKGKPTFTQFLSKLRAFFLGADVLYTHNAPFDCGMLHNELLRANCTDFPWPNEIVCTVAEHQPLYGYRPSLRKLYEDIIGTKLEQEHRGLSDVKDLFAILAKEGVL